METTITTLEKKIEGESYIVTKQLIETLDAQDLANRRQQLAYRQADTRKQIKQLEDYVDGMDAEIAECDEMLRSLRKAAQGD